jgi:hypothetical protein
MTELDRRARIAGALYTATFVPGVFSLGARPRTPAGPVGAASSAPA